MCKITQVQKFRGNAHARGRSITADFPPKLIRNQQVIGSSRIAGSNRIDHFSLATWPAVAQARCYRAV
jgi:hypothetical protein